MFEMIELTIGIEPRPMPRPRFANGKTYAPQDISNYKEFIRWQAALAMRGREPLAGELKCSMKFYRKYKRTSRRFGDLDNLFKAVADALNGICYADDAQIISATIEKFVDKNFPRVEIKICAGPPEQAV